MARHHAAGRGTVGWIGAALTLAVVGAATLPFAEGWERRSIDLRFERAPRSAAPLDPAIVFVDIDDGALEVGGRWPWPRERLALALGELARAGARTVALDLLLVESEAARDGTEGEGDLQLARALATTRSVLAVDLGDQDARSGTQQSSRSLALQQRLRALERERGALPSQDEWLGSLRPADPSVVLSRRDAELAGALHAQERAWRALARCWLAGDSDGPPFAKAPLASLAEPAAGAGFVNFTPDRDGALRVVAATRPVRGGEALQLGLAAARVHLGGAVERPALPLHDGELWLVWPATRSDGATPTWLRCAPHVSLGRALEIAEAERDLARQAARQRELAAALAKELAIAGEGEALLEAVGEEARFRVADAEAAAATTPLTPEEVAELAPFRDFLAHDRVRAGASGQLAAARAQLDGALRDKLVFVGWTATGAASDFVPTAFSPRTPGVVAHAVAADMALSGRHLSFTPPWLAPAATIALGLLATAASLPPLWLATPLWLALLAGWSALAAGLFATRLLVVPLVAPLAAATAAWLGAVALQAAIARRNQQRITRQFKARVASELVDFLVENPDALSMAGEPREVTCFFVDLAGFTRLSEQLGAQQTVALLNRCMRAATEALTRHGAYVNKFLGDGLMAFWSAFRPDPDQATRACKAALAAQAALAAVIDPGQVAARMGLATGRAIVGDCGAPPLLHDYTAIGDAINLSARLESANKQFGTLVLVDGATRRAVADATLRFRPLGRVVVVGQTTAVDLFELAPAALPEERLEATAAAVAAFARADRAAATALFRDLATRHGESKLAAVYLDALADDAPLDGVLHLKAK